MLASEKEKVIKQISRVPGYYKVSCPKCGKEVEATVSKFKYSLSTGRRYQVVKVLCEKIDSTGGCDSYFDFVF